ncbi:MAG: hypothetical protein INQ03_18625 [Candidatus Heimdallarchaeota archaeon]|nr:hypothetical protein [Candidatus Heimdallarchaeota archaeon]
MSYITRAGTIFSFKIVLITAGIIVLIGIKADYENQVAMLEQSMTIPDLEPEITIWLGYFLLSLLTCLIWYPIAKIFSPTLGLFIARIYGVTAQPFLDKKIKKRRVGIAQFLTRYANLAISLFALDFLLSNSLYNYGSYPPFISFISALVIITFVQPMNFALEDIGLRLYKESTNEVLSVTSLLDRFIFKFIQTSSLVGSLAVISLNSDLIDNIPVQVRVIFVRSFIISLLILYLYTLLFQVDADKKLWKNRSIIEAEVKLK